MFRTDLGYTDVDQRETETVVRTLPDGSDATYTAGYTYNTRNELTAVTATGDYGPTAGTWTYDGVGNRTGYAGGANDLNQYANFVYDARGNLLNDGVFEYTWDALDRLTSVTKTDGSVRVEFGYDGSGQRIEKRVYSRDGDDWITTASQTTKFVYDGQNLVAELDGSNTLLRSYTWAGGTLLAVTDHTEGGPTTYDVISDATGSVVALRAADGTVAASYRYDAWGNLLEAAGPAADVCHIRFALGYADDETGLQYHQARYYSPTQHRWISRDPIAESGGVNVYAYCGNDPVNAVDPSGLDPEFTLTPQVGDRTGPVSLPRPNPFIREPFTFDPDPIDEIWAAVPKGSLSAEFIERTARMSPRQKMGLYLGGQIAHSIKMAKLRSGAAEQLRREWNQAVLDAKVAGYGERARWNRAGELRDQAEAARNGARAWANIQANLRDQFHNLGLDSETWHGENIGSSIVYWHGEGVEGAIECGMKVNWLAPPGLEKTFLDEAVVLDVLKAAQATFLAFRAVAPTVARESVVASGSVAVEVSEGAAASRIAAIRSALSDANGNLLSSVEREGLKFTIRRVEEQGFRLTGAIKYAGNQGIDLAFEGVGANAGRFALAEAKASRGLGALKVDSLGIRQGSFDFFDSRLQRAGEFTLQQHLQAGNVDLLGGFAKSERLYQFDPVIFQRNVNFAMTPGAARLVP